MSDEPKTALGRAILAQATNLVVFTLKARTTTMDVVWTPNGMVVYQEGKQVDTQGKPAYDALECWIEDGKVKKPERIGPDPLEPGE